MISISLSLSLSISLAENGSQTSMPIKNWSRQRPAGMSCFGGRDDRRNERERPKDYGANRSP